MLEICWMLPRSCPPTRESPWRRAMGIFTSATGCPALAVCNASSVPIDRYESKWPSSLYAHIEYAFMPHNGSWIPHARLV